MIRAMLFSQDGAEFVAQFNLPVSTAPASLFAQTRLPVGWGDPQLDPAALVPQMKFERFPDDDLSMQLVSGDGRVVVYRQVPWPPEPV